MLIVVEGLDGAGKSTQVSSLKKYLEERAGGVEYIHFPRYGAPVYGDLIAGFLRGEFGGIDSVHPKLVAFLYAEDRRDAAPGMRTALEKGECILLDRYVYSNIAFQCAKVADPGAKEDLKKWILDTEYGDFSLPVPDLNLFLDVPLGFVEKNLSSHRTGADRNYLEGSGDIHEADISFQEKVRREYLAMCVDDPRFVRIDCSSADGTMLPPEAISAAVRKEVDKIL